MFKVKTRGWTPLHQSQPASVETERLLRNNKTLVMRFSDLSGWMDFMFSLSKVSKAETINWISDAQIDTTSAGMQLVKEILAATENRGQKGIYCFSLLMDQCVRINNQKFFFLSQCITVILSIYIVIYRTINVSVYRKVWENCR